MIAVGLAALLVMVALVIDPTTYAQSVTNGLLLFVMSVLPSMLPFFFLSGLFIASGLAARITSRTRWVGKLYHAPSDGAYVLLLSFLSGYPVGAKLTAELYEQGRIDTRGAKHLTAFTSATGPMFVLGAVAGSILHDPRAGLCILAAHYLSALINGLLYRGKRQDYSFTPRALPPVEMDRMLWDTACNTVLGLMVAGLYITLFNVLADMANQIGLWGLLVGLLEKMGANPALSRGIVFGLTEMTRGCVELAGSGASIRIVAPLCCMLISFGGLCVALQSIAYLSKCKVKPLYYLLCKTTQGLLSLGLCFLFCLALPAAP